MIYNTDTVEFVYQKHSNISVSQLLQLDDKAWKN